jgi:multidrug resistance efflux pump
MTDSRSPVDPVPATEEAQAAATPPSDPAGSGWRPRPPSRTALFVIVALALGGVLAVLAAWRLPPFANAYQSTDNAYVRGRTTVIAPQVSGYVTQVYVRDFMDVTAGQPLVQSDDRIYRQRVDQASAQVNAQEATLANALQSERSRTASLAAQTAAVANAQAQLMRAQADMNRVNDLVTDGSVSLRERDQTLAALRQAQAAVQQANAARQIAQQDIRTVQVGRGGQRAGVSGAEATRRLAQIDLANTVIRAPESGRLSEVGVRVGQPASFTVDGLANARLSGHIERISPAAGSEFAVLKADNATGNFTKVPQRIAVRIRIDPGQPLRNRLRPGMSVQARIDTTNGPVIR